MKFVWIKDKIRLVKHSPILGHGMQGTVFKVGNYAVKVYNNAFKKKSKPDAEVAIRLSHLNLQSFVTPSKLKISGNRLHKFRMALLHPSRNRRFVDMDIEDVIRNLKMMREDIEKLTDNGIALEDFLSQNVCICGDDIKLFDYFAPHLSSDKNLDKVNNGAVDSLFGSTHIMHEMKSLDAIDVYDNLYADFLKSGFTRIEDYYEDRVAGKFKTVSEYLNSKVKKKVPNKFGSFGKR